MKQCPIELTVASMSPHGPKPHWNEGQSISALPLSSDVYLFCYRERVIDLYPEVSNGTLDLCVPEQKLHSPQVACAPVDQRCFGSAK